MRILKILGIIFMVISSMLGGAAVRLMEVWNDPNPLPLPNHRKQKLPDQEQNYHQETQSLQYQRRPKTIQAEQEAV